MTLVSFITKCVGGAMATTMLGISVKIAYDDYMMETRREERIQKTFNRDITNLRKELKEHHTSYEGELVFRRANQIRDEYLILPMKSTKRMEMDCVFESLLCDLQQSIK